jgi:hypothetical protein
MPNAIKYNVSAETLALKKGNFWIGTGDVGKGPTSSTGYYNGITPPSGGYTIYLNKETSGPSIYTVSTEAQLVSLTNTIGAQNFTTSGQCLNWFATQTDKMIFNRDYEPIVTNGLVLNLDAGFTPSYPTTNTTWYDVSSGGNNGTLINGPTFNSEDGGSIVFDGVDDYIALSKVTSFGSETPHTYSAWIRVTSFGNPYRWIIDNGSNTQGSSLVLTNTKLTYFFSGGRQLISSNSNLVANTWYNVTVVYDSLAASFYINGTFDSTKTVGSYFNAATINGSVGVWNSSITTTHFFVGRIPIAQIYNRALTASEVLQNYNAQKGRFGL